MSDDYKQGYADGMSELRHELITELFSMADNGYDKKGVKRLLKEFGFWKVYDEFIRPKDDDLKIRLHHRELGGL